MTMSDRISVMHFGSVIAEGTPVEIQRNAEVRRAYLGGYRGDMILEIRQIDTYYSLGHILHGLSLNGRGRRGGGLAGQKRRGEDDDAPFGHRPHAARSGEILYKGESIADFRLTGSPSAESRSFLRPAGSSPT